MITFQNYVKATSIEEAHALNQSPNNKIVGGMLWLRQGNTNFNTLIDISDLGLDGITEDDNQIKIGAMVTLRELEINAILNKYTQGAVCNAVNSIVGVQFRNMATIGGSIWGRYGFSDVLTVFLALDSYVELYKGGIVALNDFVKMKYDNDLLLSVIVKKHNCKCIYDSVRIQRTDFPVLTCAASILDNEINISIGARPGSALLYKDDEGILSAGISEETASLFAGKLSEKVPTSSNNRGSEAYRSKLVEVLAKRNILYLGGLL